MSEANYCMTCGKMTPCETHIFKGVSYFSDVGNFHAKFGLDTFSTVPPRYLDDDTLKFRGSFLLEELAEFFEACGRKDIADMVINNISFPKCVMHHRVPADLEKAADALADLVYVALGTAHLMGIPFDKIWAEVQRANMTKERATGANDARSKRAHRLDVVKPEGWKAPDHRPAMQQATHDYIYVHQLKDPD